MSLYVMRAQYTYKMTSSILHFFPTPLLGVTVLRRPSATIKSPYVADVQYDDGRVALCHSPGLGCCGLVEKGRRIYVCKHATPKKTECVAYVAECEDTTGTFYVGIHPMISQHVAQNILDTLTTDPVVWTSEVVVNEGTRIDYVGTKADGKKIYVEIKNAMVSREHSVCRTDRRAIFPDGYRKSKTDTISPRAVKHAHMLRELLARDTTDSCYLIYTVPRADCRGGLTLNTTDPTYVSAVREAVCAGVCVRAYSFAYTLDGAVRLDRELPIYNAF